MSKTVDNFSMNGHSKEFYSIEISVKSIKVSEDFTHKKVVIEKRIKGIDVDDLPCGSSMTIDIHDLEEMIHLLSIIQQKHDNSYD
jgi:predicted unusual protein kinase regulating ubiquinone biosynthesis (AarF/ABC1/UbiB family)